MSIIAGFVPQSESGPVLQSKLRVQAGGRDLRRGDGLPESQHVFGSVPPLPGAQGQGEPDGVQSGHPGLPERGIYPHTQQPPTCWLA